MAKEEIQLVLVSGFMGAGKTTFLQYILNQQHHKKIGILVNEFGPVGVDGKILKGSDAKIVEINNGSIFCACLKNNFVDTLISFSKKPIDLLLIENSGLGDPSNFLKILSEIEPYTERKYTLKGTVCIVDSQFFLEYNEIFTPVQNQIAASNFILINKTDLVDPARLEKIHETVKKINPQAYLYDTQYGVLPIEILKEHLIASDFIGETSNHDWNRPVNYLISSDKTVEQDELIEFLETIKEKILRLKGFLKAPDGYWHIDMVEDFIQLTKLQNHAQLEPELVVIGKDQWDFQSLLKETWERTFKHTPNILPN